MALANTGYSAPSASPQPVEPSASPATPLPGNPGELATTVAEAAVEVAINNTSLPSSVAKVAATVGKSLVRTCARRAMETTPDHAIESMVTYDILGEEEDAAPRPTPQDAPCINTSDPRWRWHVHLKKDTSGKASLEECVSE